MSNMLEQPKELQTIDLLIEYYKSEKFVGFTLNNLDELKNEFIRLKAIEQASIDFVQFVDIALQEQNTSYCLNLNCKTADLYETPHEINTYFNNLRDMLAEYYQTTETEKPSFTDNQIVFDTEKKEIFAFDYKRDRYIVNRLEIYTNQIGKLIID